MHPSGWPANDPLARDLEMRGAGLHPNGHLPADRLTPAQISPRKERSKPEAQNAHLTCNVRPQLVLFI